MTELLHILLDPAHWLAEVVMDVTFAVTIGKLMVRRHDRKHHDDSSLQLHAYEGPDGLYRPLKHVVTAPDGTSHGELRPTRPNPTPHWMNCELPRWVCKHKELHDEAPRA